jgi:putative FmdB family regulatory protein
MPIFEFKCEKCGKHFERIVKTDDKTCVCDCGEIAHKDGDIFGKNLIFFKEPGGVYAPGFGERKHE